MANSPILALVALLLVAVVQSRNMVKRQAGLNKHFPDHNFPGNTGRNQCGNGITRYIDYNDCSRYFHCDAYNTPTMVQCGTGHVFNSMTLKCDWPSNVQNGNTCILPPRFVDKNYPNSNNLCGNGFSRHVDYEDCSKFFECDQHGHPILKQCGTGLIFNGVTHACDQFANVQTGRTCKMPPRFQNRNNNNRCGNGITMYVDSSDCSKYFRCDTYGNPTPLQCQTGMIFNSLTLRCDYTNNMQTPNNCQMPSTNPNNQCTYNTMYVDPSDCSKYFICDNYGNPTRQQCQSGMIFNSVTYRCDYTNNVQRPTNCQMPSTTNPNNQCSYSKMYVDARDCSKYFVCDNYGNPTLQRCQAGMIFNSAAFRCDYQYNMQIPTNCQLLTNKNLNTKCGQNGVSMYVDPNDCSRFYECDTTGNAILKSCGPGTVFNEFNKQCDWPANVQGANCRKNPVLNAKPDIERLCASNPNGDNSQAFLVAHPTICNAFYMCQAGMTHDPCVFCGEGTYFPQGGSTCMHNVGDNTNTNTQGFCGNRRYVAHRDITQQTLSRECSALTTGGLAGRNDRLFTRDPYGRGYTRDPYGRG